MSNYIIKKDKNNHITKDMRLKIEALYNNGFKASFIAKEIGCCRATIYNELKRGFYQHKCSDWTFTKKYSAEIAQKDYDYKATAKGVPLKIGNDYDCAEFIEFCIIEMKWSPDTIAGFIRVNNLSFTHLSTNTIYNYIRKNIFLNITEKNLLMKGHKKRTYNKVVLPSRNTRFNSISERSEEINSRETFCHWEMDTVIGIKNGKRECLLVFTERITRNEIIRKISDKTIDSVKVGLKKIKKDFGKSFPKVFKSITCDNGSEFSDYFGMKKIVGKTEIFYCHPYSSWERGSNENQNKLIRRFIPKGVDIGKFSDEFIIQIQNFINSLPRKIFGYKSSHELFSQYLQQVA